MSIGRTTGSGQAHSLFPWPASFPPSVADSAIAAHGVEGGLLVDPFCGSGTSLVCARAHGMRALGVDLNPIAALYATAVTASYSPDTLSYLRSVAMDLLEGRWPGGEAADIPEFHNRDHWFSREAQLDLARLLGWVSMSTEPEQTLLKACFAVAVQAASLQDSETRYARVEREYSKGAAFHTFGRRLVLACDALLDQGSSLPEAQVFCGDARTQSWPTHIDLLITSPPYINTYDYYLYHKQKMHWLGLPFEDSRDNEIGSRLNHSSRKLPTDDYTTGLESALAAPLRHLAPGGHAVVIIGDGIVAGQMFNAGAWMAKFGESLGMTLISHSSEPLDQRTARFNPRFRSPGKSEHTIVLRG